MGVVYRAYDRERRIEVALKSLRRVTGSSLYRFKREFRSLTNIVHPNLVTLYELRSVGEEWFFTMELIDGVPFMDWLRPKPPSVPSAVSTETLPTRERGMPLGSTEEGIDDQRTRRAFRQLASAVHCLHKANKLHRDIKPSNVLVDAEGRVVLCDFGLVADVDRSDADQTHQRMVVGTPMYMSPEQAADETLSEASDWYSVGVMLYEAITGVRPFGGNMDEVLELKKSCDPPFPQSLSASAPSDLSDLCMAMMSRDPARRPDGDAVLAKLGARQRRATNRPRDISMVGRDEHLAFLRDALEATRATERCVAVFVEGESGMGKSLLVRQFLDEVGDAGEAMVLQGRCYERESVPYKALDAMVDALSGQLMTMPEELVEEIMPRDIKPLARLFPVLDRVEAIADPDRVVMEPPDPQESRRRAFGALRHLLRRLGERQPVVFYIDDLQWGDIDSAPFLTDLIHHPNAPAVLLLGCYRVEDAETSPLLQQLLSGDRAGVSGDMRRLEVGALTDDEARALVEHTMGREMLSGGRVEAIVLEGGGNPYFIDELTRAASRAPSSDTSTAVSLDEVLMQRVDELPDDARAFLTAAAMVGRPVPIEVPGRASGIDNEAEAIAVLTSERLARTRQVGDAIHVEPYHDRIRATILAHLSDHDTEQLHLAVARALEEAGAAEPQEVVEHWLGAGDVDRAGRAAAQAARRAEAALAFHRAAKYYSLALELQELPDEERSAMMGRLGDALANAGRLEEAARIYREATDGASELQSLDLRRRALEQLFRAGILEEGMELTRGVLREIGLSLPGGRKRALLFIALRRLKVRLRGLGFTERREEDVDEDLLRRIDVLWSVTSGLGFVDPILGMAVQTQHLVDSLKAGEPRRVAIAFALEFTYLSLSGSGKKRAEELVPKTLELAERLQDPHAIGICKSLVGVSGFVTGRWRLAVEKLREGSQTLRDQCRGVRWEIDLGNIWHMAALANLGEIRELTRTVPVLVREAEDQGNQYAAVGLRTWRSNICWLALDDPEEAQSQAIEGAAVRFHEGFHAHDYYELNTLGQIDLYRGDGPGAWKRVSNVWKEVEGAGLLRFPNMFIEANFLRARCALANVAAGGNRDAMLATVDESAARLEKAPLPWGTACGKLVRACAANVRGNQDEALAQLVAAAIAFDGVDMALLAAIARRLRGQLLGGDEGAALIQESTRWMTDQAVANVDAMTELYAPGFLR